MYCEFTNKEAVFNLRYGLGCALEGTFAIWLFVHADSYRPFGFWIACFMLGMTAFCLLYGLGWYFCWAYERGGSWWYLAGVASLIGVTCVDLNRLFAFGFQEWDIALSLSVLYFAAGWGIWRLARFIVVRSFDVLLFAVSEIGSAWRGELRR
jgi:hypothetical protein